MEKASLWKDIALESLTKVWFEISSIFPNIIGTISCVSNWMAFCETCR